MLHFAPLKQKGILTLVIIYYISQYSYYYNMLSYNIDKHIIIIVIIDYTECTHIVKLTNQIIKPTF